MKPDYGIDAPGLCRFFFISGLTALVLLCAAVIWLPQSGFWFLVIKTLLGIFAVYLLGMGCLMVYDSKVTKIATRDRLLSSVKWHGEEQVLDVGCGRGLMMVGAAMRLTSGKAIGVDIWQAEDQSENSPAGAIENAKIANVENRVVVQTADMRKLPFADESFDVVLTAWAVHNLKEEADRKMAVGEMARVLKRGGQLVLSDIEHRAAYVGYLQKLGFQDFKIVVSPVRDFILNCVSFGSYRPSAIIAKRPL